MGVTEKNLARAFAAAGEEQAVLLLDEVDSFLQERRKATQSWEITAVNEMLTQMEHYRGLFIASTNLMDDLDAAALRRGRTETQQPAPQRLAGGEEKVECGDEGDDLGHQGRGEQDRAFHGLAAVHGQRHRAGARLAAQLVLNPRRLGEGALPA